MEPTETLRDRSDPFAASGAEERRRARKKRREESAKRKRVDVPEAHVLIHPPESRFVPDDIMEEVEQAVDGALLDPGQVFVDPGQRSKPADKAMVRAGARAVLDVTQDPTLLGAVAEVISSPSVVEEAVKEAVNRSRDVDRLVKQKQAVAIARSQLVEELESARLRRAFVTEYTVLLSERARNEYRLAITHRTVAEAEAEAEAGKQRTDLARLAHGGVVVD